jgi:hypothetical protein
MEITSTVKTAALLVSNYADSQSCLDREFRDALKIVASAAMLQQESEQIKALKNIIHHAWIHSGYSDLGRDKMTSDERAFYDSLKAEFSVAGES